MQLIYQSCRKMRLFNGSEGTISTHDLVYNDNCLEVVPLANEFCTLHLAVFICAGSRMKI